MISYSHQIIHFHIVTFDFKKTHNNGIRACFETELNSCVMLCCFCQQLIKMQNKQADGRAEKVRDAKQLQQLAIAINGFHRARTLFLFSKQCPLPNTRPRLIHDQQQDHFVYVPITDPCISSLCGPFIIILLKQKRTHDEKKNHYSVCVTK